MSPDELVAACLQVLEAEAAKRAGYYDCMALAREAESRRMRRLVSGRYTHSHSLIEVARKLRQQNLKAKAAASQLADHPFKCVDGTIVAFERDEFVVKLGGKEVFAVGEEQFIKRYWPQGKLPSTA